MKNRFVLCGAIMLLFSWGCSPSVEVQKDAAVNLKNYHTYTWVETRSGENDKSERAISYADIPVRNAANPKLQEAGWKEVDKNPDALIGYDVLVEQSSEQRSTPVYTEPFTRYYYNPALQRWGRIYFPSQFVGYRTYETPVNAVTLTLTIIDAKTEKPIWQGWTSDKTNYTRLSGEQIESSVNSILKKFRKSLQ